MRSEVAIALGAVLLMLYPRLTQRRIAACIDSEALRGDAADSIICASMAAAFWPTWCSTRYSPGNGPKTWRFSSPSSGRRARHGKHSGRERTAGGLVPGLRAT